MSFLEELKRYESGNKAAAPVVDDPFVSQIKSYESREAPLEFTEYDLTSPIEESLPPVYGGGGQFGGTGGGDSWREYGVGDYAGEFGKSVPRGALSLGASAISGVGRMGIDALEHAGFGVDPVDFETRLTPENEEKFKEWKKKYAPKDSGYDYDLRGAFAAGVTPDPKTGHWPDTFKKPNHPTFSNESKYAKRRPDLAGRWEGEKFIPPQTDAMDDDVLAYLKVGTEAFSNASQQGIEKALPVTPGFEDSWTRKIGEGVGSAIPTIGAAMVGGLPLMAAMGGSAAYENTYQNVMELTNGDERTAKKYARISGLVTTVAEPFSGIASGLKIFKRLDKATAGWVGKELVKASGSEALTEIVEEIPDEIARQSYIDERKLIDSLITLAETGIVGGTVGAIFGGTALAIKAKVDRGNQAILDDYNERVAAGQTDPIPSKEVFRNAGFADGGGSRTKRGEFIADELAKPKEGEVEIPAQPAIPEGDVPPDISFPVQGATNAQEVQTEAIGPPGPEGQAQGKGQEAAEVNDVLTLTPELVEATQQQMRDAIKNPDLSPKQRADSIANLRQLVNFVSQGGNVETDYFKGDRIAFTGNTTPEGYREFIYLEGTKAGAYGVSPTKEMRNATVERNQREHQEQQEQFRKLRESQSSPPPAEPRQSATPATKQPSWGMTKDEFLANEERIYEASPANATPRTINRPFPREYWAGRHYEFVRAAVIAGEPVPQKVLADYSKQLKADLSADYPDLAAKVKPNEGRGAKQPWEMTREEWEAQPDFIPATMETVNVRRHINDLKQRAKTENAVNRSITESMIRDAREALSKGKVEFQRPAGEPPIGYDRGTRNNKDGFLRQSYKQVQKLAAKVKPATKQEPTAGMVEGEGPSITYRNMGPNLASIEAIDKLRRTGVRMIKAIQQAFRPRGKFPQKAFDVKTAEEASLLAAHQEIRWAHDNLKKAIKEDFGTGKLSQRGEKLISDAFEDQAIRATLPQKTADAITAARALIDSYHRQIVATVPMGVKLQAAFDAKEGIYMRRTYQAHKDPEWFEKVPQYIRDNFKQQLIQQHPQFNNNQLDQLINTMLYDASQAANPLKFFATGKIGSKDVSGLMHRKDLSEAFRNLLGEEKNPLTNFVRTTLYQSRLLSTQKFLNAVRDIGTKDGWLFAMGDPNADPKAMAEIASKGDWTMNPLDGFRTYPEIADAFNKHFNPKEASLPMQWYFRALLFAKLTKTVLSHVSQIRNMIANPKMLLQNGHLKLWNVKDPMRAVLADLGWIKNPPSRDYLLELQRKEIWNQSSTAQELNAIARGAIGKAIESEIDPTIGVLSKLKGVGGKLWQIGDNIFRVFFYEAEKARFRAALPGSTDAEIDRMAVDATKRLMPTASQIVPAVRAAQKIPFIETFIGFHAEMIRTKFNLIKTIKSELSSPNRKIKAIGAERLAGTLASMAIKPAIAAGIYALFGINGDNEDDVAELLHEYQENNPIMLLSNPKDGKIRYIDTAFTDPDNVLVTPFVAAMRSDNWEEFFLRSAGQAFGTFVGENIITEALIDLVRGRDKDGYLLWSEQDSFADKTKAAAERIGKVFVPGSAVSLDRLRKAYEGTIDPSGRSYDLNTEATGQFGFRAQEMDVRQRINQLAGRFHRDTTEAADKYRRLLTQRGPVNDEDILAARQSAEASRRELFEEMHDDVMSAIKLGVPIDEVKAALRAGGVSKDDANDLVANKYEAYEPSKQLEKKFENKMKAVPKEGSTTTDEYKRRSKLR